MLYDHSTSLLVESPTYSGALAALRPMGGKLVEVETDGDGLIPASLDAVMKFWDEAKQGPRPKVCVLCVCCVLGAGCAVSYLREYDLLYNCSP